VTRRGPGTGLVKAVSTLLERQAGYKLDMVARDRLARAMTDAAEADGRSVPQYVADLEHSDRAVQDLLDSITVQETWFFREPAHFQALAERVLPEHSDPFTIWCAGCANGQEAWSLAMTLHEAGRTDARVVATDLSSRALDRAAAGRYSERELRGLSDLRRNRFLNGAAGGHEVRSILRPRVRFLHHNLATEPPPVMIGNCPVIFCRNVLIYLSAEARSVVLEWFARILPPGGWLFLGFSESLWQVTDAFEAVRVGNAFAYRRTRAGAPGAVAGGTAVQVPAGRGRPRDRAPGTRRDRQPPAGRRAPEQTPEGGRGPGAAPEPGPVPAADRRTAGGRPDIPAQFPARPVDGPAGAGVNRSRPGPAPEQPVTLADPPAPGSARGSTRPEVAPGTRPGSPPNPSGPDLGGGALEQAAPAPDLSEDQVSVARARVFEHPDDPLAHLDLGLSLEIAGDPGAARRAFAAARMALDRCDPETVEAALKGWRLAQLAQLLESRLAVGAPGPLAETPAATPRRPGRTPLGRGRRGGAQHPT
jgi:chemotaxis protein methyltransferase CheR